MKNRLYLVRGMFLAAPLVDGIHRLAEGAFELQAPMREFLK
jgi:hypothetical protein